jgi:hypothetical protein
MKQELKNKLIFVAGSVFGLMILGALIQVVGAQQYQWAPPPPEGFPNANTYPPIDIGPDPQVKLGSLTIGESLENGLILSRPQAASVKAISLLQNKTIDSGENRLYLNANGNIVFSSVSGGLLMPKLNTPPTNPAPGMIYYENGSGTVKLRNNDNAWVDIGTGSGEGYWKYLAAGGIYYTEDASPGTVTRVVISDSEVQSTFAYELLGTYDTSTGASGALPCDTNSLTRDCPNPYTAASGSLGDKKYDRWEYEYCAVPTPGPSSYGCDQYATQVQYNIYEYRSSVSTPSNGSELIVGQIKAKDITLDDPKWSRSQSVAMTGTKKLGMDDYVESWVVCPNGYFMSGFRFGRDGDSDLNAVIQCSKL